MTSHIGILCNLIPGKVIAIPYKRIVSITSNHLMRVESVAIEDLLSLLTEFSRLSSAHKSGVVWS